MQSRQSTQVPAPQISVNGRFWLDRRELAVDDSGSVTVILTAPWGRSVELVGTPERLRKVAEGIIAQCDSAEVNTR
jgi:hypothetical protein